jgi:hypothetical protein
MDGPERRRQRLELSLTFLHLPYRDNENDLPGFCKSIKYIAFKNRLTNSVCMADVSLDPRSASLQLAGISKTYGPAHVLIDVSLSINPGEVRSDETWQTLTCDLLRSAFVTVALTFRVKQLKSQPPFPLNL